MGPSDFVSALYGALLGDGHAAGGVQSGASSYVTLEWPGLPLDPQVFGNLWATDNPTGSPEALESFSGVVDDQVPAMAPLYQPAGISLEQVYSLILQATVATGPVANAFAAAQAKFAGTARGSLQNAAVQFHASTPVPRTWCDPAGDSGWTTITIGGDSAPAPPPPIALRPLLASASLMQWRVSPILAARAPMPAAGRPMLTRAMAPQFSAVSAQARVSPAMSIAVNRSLVASMRPQVSAAVAPAVKPMVLAAAVAQLRTLPPGRVAMPSPVVVLPPPTTQPVAATKLAATFRYTRVAVQRPWLDSMLFRLPGWSIGGLPAGSISNGQTDTNPGMLPLLPVAFIAVKDVTINGSWSDADKKTAGDAVSGKTAAAFGPFTLGTDAKGSFDGSSLKVPGIQLIAWICQPMPKLPPV